MGAGIDAYNGYAQRGSFHVVEHQLAAAIELFPIFARAKLLRTWGGIVDICPDASPILSSTPIENLYLNCGWGTGGFKATPGSGWTFADLVARGVPGPLARPFSLERFTTGRLEPFAGSRSSSRTPRSGRPGRRPRSASGTRSS
jgi:sarcosine oxidase subunit beta